MSQSLLRHCFSIAIFTSFSLSAMYGEKSIQIKQENLFVPQSLGKIDLYHDDDGFKIANEYGITRIKPYNVDKELRGVPQKDLAKLITAKSYISVKELNNGEDYSLKLNHRLNGGGLFGAWLGSTLGYGAVTFLGHSAIHVAAIFTGPLYGPTVATLTAMYAIPIHSAACAAGIAGGVTIGSITGPV